MSDTSWHCANCGESSGVYGHANPDGTFGCDPAKVAAFRNKKAGKAAYEAIRRVKGKDFELARLASLFAAKVIAGDDAYVDDSVYQALRDYLAANYLEAMK